MSEPTKRQTGKFVAYDATGKAYTVYIYTDYFSTGTASDRPILLAGRTDLHLANGWPVTRMCQGQYEITAKGIILQSNDLNAP